jgi:hypothetical protein
VNSELDLETRVAVLEAKIEGADLAGLRRELALLSAKVDAGFSRVSGALWAFAVVGGLVTGVAALVGAFFALR